MYRPQWNNEKFSSVADAEVLHQKHSSLLGFEPTQYPIRKPLP
jgi:hypothetical protein